MDENIFPNGLKVVHLSVILSIKDYKFSMQAEQNLDIIKNQKVTDNTADQPVDQRSETPALGCPNTG